MHGNVGGRVKEFHLHAQETSKCDIEAGFNAADGQEKRLER